MLRVTDFGIGGLAAQPVLERVALVVVAEGNMSSVLTGSYSPLYASPQQMRGDKPDPRDDVYALGVIWYQLLNGDLASPAPTGRRWVDELRKRGMSDAAVDLLSSCFESDPATGLTTPACSSSCFRRCRRRGRGEAGQVDAGLAHGETKVPSEVRPSLLVAPGGRGSRRAEAG